MRPPFFCEYGNLRLGDRTFINVDAIVLDVAAVTIGTACQIATRMQLLTATHPIDPEPRRIGWECAEPITIADNVWPPACLPASCARSATATALRCRRLEPGLR